MTLFFRRVTVGGGDREDEAAAAEADPGDQDGFVGGGQHDHVSDVDITGQDHVLHTYGRYRACSVTSSMS